MTHSVAILGASGSGPMKPEARRELDRARRLHREGDARRAMRIYTRLLDAYPGQPDLLILAATAALQLERDDQAETLLLQMFRGAGVEGLSAMPVVRSWNRGWLARPLLGVQRKSIRAWAEARGLDLDIDQAREHIYGMSYSEWKAKYQTEATPEQLEAFRQVMADPDLTTD